MSAITRLLADVHADRRLRATVILLARRRRNDPREPEALQELWHALLLAIEDGDRERLGLPPLGGGGTICAGSHASGTPGARTEQANIPPRTPGSEPTRRHDQGRAPAQGERTTRRQRSCHHPAEAPRGPLPHD